MQQLSTYPSYETAAFDAIARIGRLLDLTIDADEPEPAIIAAVERAVTQAIMKGKLANNDDQESD